MGNTREIRENIRKMVENIGKMVENTLSKAGNSSTLNKSCVLEV